jgi:hypothetical protein
MLLPTGPGQPRSIRTGRFDNILRAAFFSGAEKLVLAANLAGHAPRLYVQPVSGGDPRAITPEGVGSDFAVSADGTRVAATGTDRRLLLYRVEGGEPSPARGAFAGDAPIRFTPDGRFLYVLSRGEGAAASIHRLDLSTGRRELWKELTAADPTGIHGIPRVFLSADGLSYVYTYVRLLDELYLVDGLS